MQEVKTILRAHAARYPNMEPRDAVKLIYQNEFGGGHMIRDEESCREFLLREYAATPQLSDCPLTEAIGNGLGRVMLGALDAHHCTAAQVASAFLRSAAVHHGSPERFLKKLAVLEELTHEEEMPFSPEALEAYLIDYARDGYPQVSHTETYRAAYHPAYRVVDLEIFEKTLTTLP